jgi:hypothetical protein
LTADNSEITTPEAAQRFLRGLNLRADAEVVRGVVDVLRKRSERTLYDLYKPGRRRDGSERTPICGKGTVDKISRLYREGKLAPYLEYLNSQGLPDVRGDQVSATKGQEIFLKVGGAESETAEDLQRSVMIPRGELEQIRQSIQELSALSANTLPPLPDPHWQTLIPTLLDLRGIGQLALADIDLAIPYSRPQVTRWPIAKGEACRDAAGNVTVELTAEGKIAWKYLKQHLAGDGVWNVIEDWKKAMAGDLASRLALLDVIIQHIEKPVREGGTGLPVINDMDPMGSPEPAISLQCAMDTHHQVMSHGLNLPLAMHPKEAYRKEHPGVVSVAGQPFISSSDPVQLEAAIECLWKAQMDWASLPEAKAAAEAYRAAEQATGEVKRHLERLALALTFPRGSSCEGCPGWNA